MLETEEVSKRIASGIPEAEVTVRDLTGTGDHFEAVVISPAFVGKGMVEQHQMVYAPLQDLISSGRLHALALKTYSPEQWAQAATKSRSR